jgi:hypothetical protein
MRTKIDDKRRSSVSKRALDGKLSVELKKCPYCNHHKRFLGNSMGHMINKCTKCKREY